MYARFLFALALALTITGLSALGQAQATSRSVVCCSPGAERAMAAVTTKALQASATLLPTVTVRPSAADLLALRSHTSRSGLTALAAANLDQAGDVLAGKVRDRVSRASLLVPYYAFGGPRTRATE